MNLRYLPPLALLLILMGCTTSPTELANSSPVKPQKLLPDYALYSHPVPYGAKLVIIRDSAKLDAFERAELLVDGRSVAYLRPRERTELYVYAADHVLGLVSAPGFLDSPDVYHSFVMKPGQTYYFRVGVVGHALDIRPAPRPH